MSECAALSRECLRILSTPFIDTGPFTPLTTRHHVVVVQRMLINQYWKHMMVFLPLKIILNLVDLMSFIINLEDMMFYKYLCGELCIFWWFGDLLKGAPQEVNVLVLSAAA